VLCFTQLGFKTSVSWVPIFANLTIHVIMYYYYFTTAAFPSYKPWYKKVLTSLQISQFVIDIFIVYFVCTLVIIKYLRQELSPSC
ncbi:hypothetical protein BY996DRAFT_4550610, partial [Phakopsora pachyrhizi]